MLREKKIQFLAAPVSGNAKVIKAGKLTFVVSGPKAAYDAARPYLDMMGTGSSYVGEGELARIAKICHNVMLGVVIQNLCEITILAQKAGMPRHAFLDFLNKSVMGSMFTRYKTPALVNLDFHVTFTPKLLRKDLDLGLDAGPRVRGADAAHLGHARSAAADDRARHDRAGFLHADCCAGEGLGHRAQAGEQGGRRWPLVVNFSQGSAGLAALGGLQRP